jgi:hypothetical protein
MERYQASVVNLTQRGIKIDPNFDGIAKTEDFMKARVTSLEAMEDALAHERANGLRPPDSITFAELGADAAFAQTRSSYLRDTGERLSGSTEILINVAAAEDLGLGERAPVWYGLDEMERQLGLPIAAVNRDTARPYLHSPEYTITHELVHSDFHQTHAYVPNDNFLMKVDGDQFFGDRVFPLYQADRALTMYSTTMPSEFVAEVGAGLMYGTAYSQDTMAFYRELGGTVYRPGTHVQ